MTKFPDEINSARCKLRAIDSNDVSRLYDILQDVEVKKYLSEFYEITSTPTELEEVLKSYEILSSRKEAYLWGIWHEEILIGFISVIDIPIKPTIFYALHSDFRKKGLMSECIRGIITHFRDSYALPSLFSEVDEENIASAFILKSCGFEVVKKIQNKNLFELKLKR